MNQRNGKFPLFKIPGRTSRNGRKANSCEDKGKQTHGKIIPYYIILFIDYDITS